MAVLHQLFGTICLNTRVLLRLVFVAQPTRQRAPLRTFS